MFELEEVRERRSHAGVHGLAARLGLVPATPLTIVCAAACFVGVVVLFGSAVVDVMTGRSSGAESIEILDAPSSPDVGAAGVTVSASSRDTAAEGAEKSDVIPQVVVHVAGAVRTPGLYSLPSGSRVGDAVRIAGGATAEAMLDAVNLAQLIVDGEQVYVPRRDEIESGGGVSLNLGGSGRQAGSTALVDLNTASQVELETLPGVGAVIAGNIIAFREEHGPFSTPEEVMDVSGIGERKFEAMREHIVVR